MDGCLQDHSQCRVVACRQVRICGASPSCSSGDAVAREALAAGIQLRIWCTSCCVGPRSSVRLPAAAEDLFGSGLPWVDLRAMSC